VTKNGAVAQLGERMNGIHEVRGSIPLGSTKSYEWLRASTLDALLSGVHQPRCTEFPAPEAIRACELPAWESELESRWAPALVRAQA
jgi:hypothetical protein